MTVRVEATHVEEATYEEGQDFVLKDGHLVVLTASNLSLAKQVAVYAPGEWIRAEVVRPAR